MCKLICGILLSILIVGCTSNQKFYSGKQLPKSAVAIISGSGISGTLGYGYSTIQIFEINGIKIDLPDMNQNSVEVLPGKYSIKIYYRNVKFISEASFELEAKAGEKYLVNFPKEKLDHFTPMSLENVWLENTESKAVIQKIENWSKIKPVTFDPGVIYIHM